MAKFPNNIATDTHFVIAVDLYSLVFSKKVIFNKVTELP